MTHELHVSKPDRTLQADLMLDGSKSISNRALIVLALSGADPAGWLGNLSGAKDTVTLRRLLSQEGQVYDAGDAGTTFRFMTAFLAIQPGIQILTGSERMQERPVGALVYALRALGADIRFLGKEGYPPLEIGTFRPGGPSEIRIEAGVSSQFLSALAMIGPYLPGGLRIIPDGTLVSRPYLDMTVQLMRHFGARADWEGDTLVVHPGTYKPRLFTVEADWSAASYWYAMVALAEKADLHLRGLFPGSWQGDAVLADMMRFFGVETQFTETGVRLTKLAGQQASVFNYDFIGCPDIAQTLAVVCGALGVEGLFTGLETLSVKETDRIAALRQELAKTGVLFGQLPELNESGKIVHRLSGRASWANAPLFETYNDHRMAMAFACMAMRGAVRINRPEVVEKSYPAFWKHLEAAGFNVI
jgi:3-phosphoshikimate 1-carboxyvinyltransferase